MLLSEGRGHHAAVGSLEDERKLFLAEHADYAQTSHVDELRAIEYRGSTPAVTCTSTTRARASTRVRRSRSTIDCCSARSSATCTPSIRRRTPRPR